MKKIILLVLTLVFGLTLVACSNKGMSEEESLDKFLESESSLSLDSISKSVVNEENFAIPDVVDLTQFIGNQAYHVVAKTVKEKNAEANEEQEIYAWLENAKVLKGVLRKQTTKADGTKEDRYDGASVDIKQFLTDAQEYVKTLPTTILPGAGAGEGSVPGDPTATPTQDPTAAITAILNSIKLTKDDLEAKGQGVYLVKQEYFNKLIQSVSSDSAVLVVVNGFFKTLNVELTIKEGLLRKVSIDLKSQIVGLFDITGSVEFDYKKEVVSSASGNLKVSVDLTKMGDKAPAPVVVKGELSFAPKNITLKVSANLGESKQSIDFELTDKSVQLLLKRDDVELLNLNANWTQSSLDLNAKFVTDDNPSNTLTVKLDKSNWKVTGKEGDKEVLNVNIVLNNGRLVSGTMKSVATNSTGDITTNVTLETVDASAIPAAFKDAPVKEMTFADLVKE